MDNIARHELKTTCCVCKREYALKDLHGIRDVCIEFVEPAINLEVDTEQGLGTVVDFDPVLREHALRVRGAGGSSSSLRIKSEKLQETIKQMGEAKLQERLDKEQKKWCCGRG